MLRLFRAVCAAGTVLSALVLGLSSASPGTAESAPSASPALYARGSGGAHRGPVLSRAASWAFARETYAFGRGVGGHPLRVRRAASTQVAIVCGRSFARGLGGGDPRPAPPGPSAPRPAPFPHHEPVVLHAQIAPGSAGARGSARRLLGRAADLDLDLAERAAVSFEAARVSPSDVRVARVLCVRARLQRGPPSFLA
jgi:hypothetical protein